MQRHWLFGKSRTTGVREMRKPQHDVAPGFAGGLPDVTFMKIKLADETMVPVCDLAAAMKCAPPDLLSRIVHDLFKDKEMLREIARVLDEQEPTRVLN
jgi:hypothetical protein